MRWLLLDEVLEVQKGQKARTRSHIPDAPFSSEVLLIEMMAQTGALLLGAETDFLEDVVFAKIEKAQFFENLSAGQSIEIEATSESLKPEGAWFDGVITSKGKKVAEARCLLMNVGHLKPPIEKPITFHESFMNHFQIRNKILV